MASLIRTVYEVFVDHDVTDSLIMEIASIVKIAKLKITNYEPFGDKWVACDYRELQPGDEGHQDPRPVADFFGTNDPWPCIGLKKSAFDRLGEYLSTYAELLPANYIHNDNTPQPIWALRPKMVSYDAMDIDNCLGDGLQTPPHRGTIERFAFFPDKLPLGIFFVHRGPGVFCDDSFKTKIDESGLKGLRFKPVWSQDPKVQQSIKDWERRVGYKLPPM